MVDPKLLEQAVHSFSDGIVITDARLPENPIIFANPAFEEMTGYAADEALGQNCRFLQGKDHGQPGLADLRRALREGLPCRVTLRNYRRDGRLFWNELTISPVRDGEGDLTHFVGVQKDITRRVVAEAQLRESRRKIEEANRRLAHLATHDPLTGLRNRRSFDERLAEEWRRAVRNGSSLTLFLADLDHFKAYNDHYGHPAGDLCLQSVAEALRASFQRPTDTVARYGGEEFVALAVGLEPGRPQGLGRALCLRVAGLGIEHAAVSGRVTISVGVATARPLDGGSPEELMRRADEALYRAKASGRNLAIS